MCGGLIERESQTVANNKNDEVNELKKPEEWEQEAINDYNSVDKDRKTEIL